VLSCSSLLALEALSEDLDGKVPKSTFAFC